MNYIVGFVAYPNQAATRIVFSVEGVVDALTEFAANAPELGAELAARATSAEKLWEGRFRRVTLFFAGDHGPEDDVPSTMISIAPLDGPLPLKVPKVLVVATYGVGLGVYYLRSARAIRDIPEVADLTPKRRKTVEEMWDALQRAKNGFSPMGLEVPSLTQYFRLCKAPPPKSAKVSGAKPKAKPVAPEPAEATPWKPLKLRAQRIDEERRLLVREFLQAHQDRLVGVDVDNLGLGEVLRYLEGGPVRARGKTYLLEGPPAIDQETYDAFCDFIAGM